LSQRDVAGSVWRFCRAAQFQVVGTAGVVAAGHQEVFWRITIPRQEGDVSDNHGSAKVLTFDLSILLLKRLITGSQSLYRQVQQDAHWASRCQPSVNDQSLVIKWGSRIVVSEDKELQTLLNSEFHDSKYAGHFGMSRTRVAVGRMIWWKSLAGNVAKFVSTCVACQRNKARHHKPYGLLQPLPLPEKPWHTVTFNFIVKLPKTSRGKDSICGFVDKLTKLVHFVACKEEVSAKEFAELYVDHVFCLHGLSREFITDREPRFTSAFWQEVTVLLGTRTVMSSSFHPQTDGQTERVNQTLETYLRHFFSVGLYDCDTLLSRAEFAHNAAVNKTIRTAPFKLTYGYHPRTSVGEVVKVVNLASAAFVERLQSSLGFARKCLIAAQQRQKAFANKNLVEKTLKVGNKVLLSTKYLNPKHSKKYRQLLPKWIGPFEVVQVVGPVAYKLKMYPGLRVHPVFYVLLLEPYRKSDRVQPPPPPIEMEGALEYEVESILEHRFWGIKNPKAYYKVACKGYGIAHNSWEPESNVVNALEVVADYWKRQAEKQAELGALLHA
jgi:hypothetical protein